MWSTVDFSDESQKVELFCIRFGSVESEWQWSGVFGGSGVFSWMREGEAVLLYSTQPLDTDWIGLDTDWIWIQIAA